eukprot:3043246-Prymnesium_polylepis.1
MPVAAEGYGEAGHLLYDAYLEYAAATGPRTYDYATWAHRRRAHRRLMTRSRLVTPWDPL